MTRTASVSLTLRVEIDDDEYQGDIPVDIEEDLRYDLEQGRIRAGVALSVVAVAAREVRDEDPVNR